MSDFVRLRVDLSGLKPLADFGKSLPRTLEKGLRRILIEFGNQVATQFRPGGALRGRSGGLARSWTTRGGAVLESSVKSTGATASIGSKHPAAAIQNYGGTVNSKGKLLAIPVGPAKTAAGVAKHASPREVPGLVFIKTRNGKLLLVKPDMARLKGGVRVSRGSLVTHRTTGTFTTWFVLVDYVMIQPSHYLDRAAEETSLVAGAIIEATAGEEMARLGLMGPVPQFSLPEWTAP